MHNRLRMHDNVNAIHRNTEEQVGFDYLKAFVDHGGRIDRDQWAHRPRGMRQSLRRRNVDEFLS
jgi:hypothetical protein